VSPLPVIRLIVSIDTEEDNWEPTRDGVTTRNIRELPALERRFERLGVRATYFTNYHVWETLVAWDAPEHYGVACKRADVRARSSAFNRRGAIAGAFAAVVARVRARRIVVSFNDEGYVSPDDMRALLAARRVVLLPRSFGCPG